MSEEIQEELSSEDVLLELEAIITSDDYEVGQKERLEALADHRNLSEKLPSEWSLTEVQSFLEMGIEPAKTSNGVYVNDVSRESKKAGAWSDAELVAWANGELKATGRASDNALAQRLIGKFKLKVRGNTPEEAIAVYKFQVEGLKPIETEEEVVENSTDAVKPVTKTIALVGLSEMNKKFIEATLAKYVEELKPGKSISRENGIILQKSLDVLIKYIINLEDLDGFKSGMDYLMGTIKKHRVGGVFDDTYALRFTDGLAVGGNVQESHNRLLTLFFIFADEDKTFRKQADVNYLVEYVPLNKQPLLLQYFEQYK